MRILADADTQRVQDYLRTHLGGPITVDLFSRSDRDPSGRGVSCPTCAETRAVLEELAALDPRLTLRVTDVAQHPQAAQAANVEHVPTVVLHGAAAGVVRFVGAPAGYEIATLVGDLSDVSRGNTSLAPATRDLLSRLERPLHLQVLVTPTCPFCPRPARLAHQMAVESRLVTADVVDVSQFPDLAQRYDVAGVPAVVIDGAVAFVGAREEAAFAGELLRAQGVPAAG